MTKKGKVNIKIDGDDKEIDVDALVDAYAGVKPAAAIEYENWKKDYEIQKKEAENHYYKVFDLLEKKLDDAGIELDAHMMQVYSEFFGISLFNIGSDPENDAELIFVLLSSDYKEIKATKLSKLTYPSRKVTKNGTIYIKKDK